MRSGPHWDGWPPDDPPEPEAWCSVCECHPEDCDERNHPDANADNPHVEAIMEDRP